MTPSLPAAPNPTPTPRWRGWLRRNGLTVLLAVVLIIPEARTEVLGYTQRLLLATGLFAPSVAADKPTGAGRADFSLPLQPLDAKAAATTLAQFRGRPIVLNLWATWCPPCRAEMPSLQKLYESTRTDDVAFVLLSLDADPAKVTRFVAKQGFTMPIFTQPSRELPAAFATNSIPTTFIIAPSGEIVVRHSGMADYDSDEMRALLHRLATGKK